MSLGLLTKSTAPKAPRGLMPGAGDRAWRVVRNGPPREALELLDGPDPQPGPGEVLVRTRATVCNYNEVDGCHGRYLTINPPLPYTLGMELVGDVIAAGPGADGWLGKRVIATSTGAIGAHAEASVAPVEMTFEAPGELDDTDAAAFFYPFHLAYLGSARARPDPGGRDRAGACRRRRCRFGRGAARGRRRLPCDRDGR